MEPRLGHDTLQLGAPLGNGPAGQRLAVFDHIAVVAFAELDLQQVIGRDGSVGVAPGQLREALPGLVVTPLGIVDIGLVVKGAWSAYSLRAGIRSEIVISRPIVPLR